MAHVKRRVEIAAEDHSIRGMVVTRRAYCASTSEILPRAEAPKLEDVGAVGQAMKGDRAHEIANRMHCNHTYKRSKGRAHEALAQVEDAASGLRAWVLLRERF